MFLTTARSLLMLRSGRYFWGGLGERLQVWSLWKVSWTRKLIPRAGQSGMPVRPRVWRQHFMPNTPRRAQERRSQGAKLTRVNSATLKPGSTWQPAFSLAQMAGTPWSTNPKQQAGSETGAYKTDGGKEQDRHKTARVHQGPWNCGDRRMQRSAHTA